MSDKKNTLQKAKNESSSKEQIQKNEPSNKNGGYKPPKVEPTKINPKDK